MDFTNNLNFGNPTVSASFSTDPSASGFGWYISGTMKAFVAILLAMIAAAAFGQQYTGPAMATNSYAFGQPWTNRVPPFTLSTISVQPVEGKCPECGGPNHHIRRVELEASYGEVFLPIFFEGRTNQHLLTTTATNKYVVTNIVFQPSAPIRTQPGWVGPPAVTQLPQVSK